MGRGFIAARLNPGAMAGAAVSRFLGDVAASRGRLEKGTHAMNMKTMLAVSATAAMMSTTAASAQSVSFDEIVIVEPGDPGTV